MGEDLSRSIKKRYGLRWQDKSKTSRMTASLSENNISDVQKINNSYLYGNDGHSYLYGNDGNKGYYGVI